MLLSQNLDDYCFIDTETRSLRGTPPELANVTVCGSYAYNNHAYPMMITYCLGHRPVQIVDMSDGFDERGFTFDAMPSDLQDHWLRAQEDPDAKFVAWNSVFDRTALYRGTQDFPKLPVEAFLDCMVMAAASNLPGKLDGCAKALKMGGKQDDGSHLINIFSNPNGPQPYEEPVLWERFRSYGLRDTSLLRDIFFSLRPLSAAEWWEFWASERINDRGALIDVHFAQRAAAMAELNTMRSNRQIAVLTNKVADKVTQVQRLTNWAYDQLRYAEAREIMVKVYDEDDEEGLKPAKLGLDRARIEALLAFFDAKEEKDDGLDETDIAIADVLEIRQWDGSATPGKFGKALVQRDHDDCLRGSYTFNGARQTGRFSSRGVQVHNLTRSYLGQKEKQPELELEAIEMINELELPA